MPGKILVVDPVVTNRIALKMLLAKDYFDVYLFDQEDGILGSILKDDPDVIVLSIKFEKNSGYDICKKLRTNPLTSHIPIVLFALDRDTVKHEADWQNAINSLADDVIVTHDDETYFLERIGHLCRRKTELDALKFHLKTNETLGLCEPTHKFNHRLERPSVHTTGVANPQIEQAVDALTEANIATRCKTPSPECNKKHVCVSIHASKHALAPMNAHTLTSLVTKQRASNRPTLFLFPKSSKDTSAIAHKLGVQEYLCLQQTPQRLALRIASLVRFEQDKHHMKQQLAHQLEDAQKDSLTGLYNRKYALSYLTRVLRAGKKSDRNIGVMMLDVDFFKLINDTLGHTGGDAVLKKLANTLQLNLRNIDLISRIGGEEFLIILPDCDRNIASGIAERLLLNVRNSSTPSQSKTSPPVTVSIGVAISRGDEDATSLIARADKALYAAKRCGRNQFQFCELAA